MTRCNKQPNSLVTNSSGNGTRSPSTNMTQNPTGLFDNSNKKKYSGVSSNKDKGKQVAGLYLSKTKPHGYEKETKVKGLVDCVVGPETSLGKHNPLMFDTHLVG